MYIIYRYVCVCYPPPPPLRAGYRRRADAACGRERSGRIVLANISLYTYTYVCVCIVCIGMGVYVTIVLANISLYTYTYVCVCILCIGMGVYVTPPPPSPHRAQATVDAPMLLTMDVSASIELYEETHLCMYTHTCIYIGMGV